MENLYVCSTQKYKGSEILFKLLLRIRLQCDKNMSLKYKDYI